MHAKLSKRRQTSPALPDSPTGATFRAKVFPQWMYRDPAEAAERLESMQLHAETRVRLTEVEREKESARTQRLFYERMGVGLRRVVLASPEIRMKRARIQALTRAAMKGMK